MADKATQGRLILPETTAAELETSNPVLRDGQLFITKDGVAKIGDGVTRWVDLKPVLPETMLRWQGQWVGATAQNAIVYKPYTVVLYDSAPYVCIKQHTLPPGPLQGGADVINPTMPEYWTPLIPPQDKNIGKGVDWVFNKNYQVITDKEGDLYGDFSLLVNTLPEGSFSINQSMRDYLLIKANITGVFLVSYELRVEYSSQVEYGEYKVTYLTKSDEWSRISYNSFFAPHDSSQNTKYCTLSGSEIVRINSGDALEFERSINPCDFINERIRITKLA